MTFENYFDSSVKLFKSMTTGLFLYPLFVALSESFDLKLHHFMPMNSIIAFGTVFIVISLIFFPLANYVPVWFAAKCTDSKTMGKKLFTAHFISAGMSETVAVFGIVIYIISGDIRYFYLFFVLAFVHLLMHRPKKDAWQKFLDRVS